MTEQVPETPAKPEVSADESLIDNPRAALESKVITENETPSPIIPAESTEPKVAEESADLKPEETSDDPIARIKQSVQKRINQVVAQKKSAEDELAEAKAEIARLKATPTQATDKKVDDAPPTLEQVEAYIIKMAEEGNKKEEIAATRYLIKLEKEAAIKEVEDRQHKIKQEGEQKIQRENQALLDLAKDYIVYDDKGQVDMKSDLTLANQKGKLFEVTMALYNDPELHKLYYNDPDRAMALRRATADAYRELHQQGMIKTPKENSIVSVRRTAVLAEPDATDSDETPTQSNSNNLLSDADKVRAEFKQRQQLRNSRKPA